LRGFVVLEIILSTLEIDSRVWSESTQKVSLDPALTEIEEF